MNRVRVQVHAPLSTRRLYGAVITILLAFYAGNQMTSAQRVVCGTESRVLYEVIEGTAYTLTCSCSVDAQFRSSTHLQISWQHQQSNLLAADLEPTARRYPVDLDDRYTSHLRFEYVDRNLDAGVYKCEAQNITIGALDGDTQVRQFELRVIWVDVPQVILVNSTESTVTLLCQYDAWNVEMVSVQWLHNFQPVTGPVERGSSRFFTIPDTNLVDASGHYHCQVTATVHLPEDTVALRGATTQKKNVLRSSNWYTLVADSEAAPQADRFMAARYKPLMFIPARTSFELECPFVVQNFSEVSWHRIVFSDEKHCTGVTSKTVEAETSSLYTRITYDRTRGSVLQVREFAADQCNSFMDFQCVHTVRASERHNEDEEERFSFSVGLAQTQAPQLLHLVATPVSVFSPDIFSTDISSERKFCLIAIMKPTVINATLQLSVRPANDPKEIVLQLSDLDLVKQPSGNIKLCMRPKVVQYGDYTLVASNAFGNSTGVITIRHWSIPVFQEYTSNVELPQGDRKSPLRYFASVWEGRSLTLNCNVTGPPYPFTKIFWVWRPRTGVNFALRYNMTGVTLFERNGTLVLSNVSVASAGNYSCLAQVLYFDGRPTAPVLTVSVLRALKVVNWSAEIDATGNLNLRCVFESESWDTSASLDLLTGLNVSLNPAMRKIDEHTRVVSAQIAKGSFPSNAFRCVASSDGQNASTSFVVELRPTMQQRPENVTAIDGDSLLLNCQPDVPEDWRVHWQHSGWSLIENCDASGENVDPCVLRNGSLRFKNVGPYHGGWWYCLVSLKTVALRLDYDYNETVFITVNERPTDANNITRTVTIVIVSAVVYLALVVGITLWCSIRLVRRRKQREPHADDTQMTLLDSENPRVNGEAKANGRTKVGAVIRANGNGHIHGQSAAVPRTTVTQPPPANGSVHSGGLPMPNTSPATASTATAVPTGVYQPGVHVTSMNSLPQSSSKHSAASPGALPPLPPPLPLPPTTAYPQRSVPAYAWPIQDIRSTLTRTSCSTCDGLSAGGVPVLCALHSAQMPSGILSDYPQSVLSHQTNVTSVSQQVYQRDRGLLLHQPATTTPNSQSNCSNETLRRISRSQVHFVGRIGLGRFGEVTFGQLTYAHGADQAALPVRVAIKTVTRTDEDAWRDFQRELETFQGIRHDFITELLGACFDDDQPPMLIFEYPEWGTLKHFLLAVRADHERLLQALVDGSPLDEQLLLPPLSLEQRIMMCLHMTAGLDFLANHGRVHGDLACRNLLLSQNLSLKVGLLGVHDVFAAEYYHIPCGGAGSRKTKPLALRWMAPECIAYELEVAGSASPASRSDSVYSPASDVWSFAMTAFEIFTYGELPFATQTDAQVIETLLGTNVDGETAAGRLTELAMRSVPRFAHVTVPPGKIGGVLPDARFNDFTRNPPSLRHVLEQCCRVDARQRPSFAEISVALGEQLVDSKL